MFAATQVDVAGPNRLFGCDDTGVGRAQDLSLFTAKPATLSLCSSEGNTMKPGIIFGVLLIVIIGGIVASHQLSESGNDHFDKAGENWKQN